MLRRLFSFLGHVAPPFIYMGGLYWLSSQPGDTLPQQPFPHFDKIVHFGLYALLAILWYRALAWFFPQYIKTMALIAFLCSVTYGGIDEWHQRSVYGRYWDIGDWVADALGAAMVFIWHRLSRRLKSKKPR